MHEVKMLMHISMFVVIATVVSGMPDPEKPRDIDICHPYRYCEGSKFPSRVEIDGRYITCDTDPTPRNECCMPHAKHLTCYSMVMNGQYFNLQGGRDEATDFTALCHAMLRSVGRTPTQYATVIWRQGPGMINFNEGGINFLSLTSSEGNHIHHLACSYEH